MALTPALQPIDGVAVSYIDAAVALGNTINEMDKYYTQENYKDDAFEKENIPLLLSGSHDFSETN